MMAILRYCERHKKNYFNIKCPICTEENKEKGKKYDTGKLRWSLLPIKPVEEIVKVLMFGANKYGDNNWQGLEGAKERYYDAMLRHIMAWKEGEVSDSESNLSHLAHAGCCLLFLLWFEINKK